MQQGNGIILGVFVLVGILMSIPFFASKLRERVKAERIEAERKLDEGFDDATRAAFRDMKELDRMWELTR